MKIGIDTNVFVAALHTKHPQNNVACSWLNYSMEKHDIIIAKQSVLECYSVLTRLPTRWRLTSAEAILLIKSNLKSQIKTALFPNRSFLNWLDKIAMKNIVGGKIYDSYIIKTLSAAKVDAIATFNLSHFSGLVDNVKLINPLTHEI